MLLWKDWVFQNNNNEIFADKKRGGMANVRLCKTVGLQGSLFFHESETFLALKMKWRLWNSFVRPVKILTKSLWDVYVFRESFAATLTPEKEIMYTKQKWSLGSFLSSPMHLLTYWMEQFLFEFCETKTKDITVWLIIIISDVNNTNYEPMRFRM